MALKLPIFEGYTVDARLRQFRKVRGRSIAFIDFDSIEGEKILSRYIESLDPENKEFKKLLHHF